MYSVVFLVIGILAGWLIWGNTKSDVTMEHTMNSMTSGLEGKTGDAFDEAFLSEMIVHHEGAVEMAEAALVNAKHPEIKTMAGAIISAQTSEIAQMKKWLTDWYAQ